MLNYIYCKLNRFKKFFQVLNKKRMKQYLNLLKRVLGNGDPQYNERTGQLMIVSAGDQSIYDLREGFPISTTKSSVPIRWIGEELFWMLRGERNAQSLYKTGVDIWNRNAFQHYLDNNDLSVQIPKNTPVWENKFIEYQESMLKDDFTINDSDLGPVYGWQWRHWEKKDGSEVDQIANIINGIKKSPGSRYHMLSAWNVAELEDMALGPCHCIAQFTITGDKDLDLNMFQRSCDIYLGVPFNIAQYSLLNHLIAQETELTPRKFIHSYGNVHIYGGVSPRTDFLKDGDNLKALQEKVRGASESGDFLEIRDWYLNETPPESEGNERKDHVPFVLEQLSKEPLPQPNLLLEKMPLEELIKKPAKEVIRVTGFKSHKWDSKAVMAA
jgi:thymidylate synthase